MNFDIGDLVTRKSHGNDIIFEIISIEKNNIILQGVEVRLLADSSVDDLVKVLDDSDPYKCDRELTKNVVDSLSLDRAEFFYLPGKILHIDADKNYLERCIKFYTNLKVEAYGINLDEDEMADNIIHKLEEYKPDILVITGHDAYFKAKGSIKDLSNYQNSKNFVNAVKKAREYEASQEKLIIIAGACQSNYEELIKAGANFASSPKRVNIHALDPAIIASSISLSEKNKSIDLISMLEKTKYKEDGMGGIITNGTMYVGFPR
ncbi:MAG: sporulation peptidase YabG [Bacilli bacterium]|nr:sporulation peptidase YabG [Bacilli bacterium]